MFSNYSYAFSDKRIKSSASLLAHNQITAPQFIRRSSHSSCYKQVPIHCLLLFAIEEGAYLILLNRYQYSKKLYLLKACSHKLNILSFELFLPHCRLRHISTYILWNRIYSFRYASIPLATASATFFWYSSVWRSSASLGLVRKPHSTIFSTLSLLFNR